MVGQQLQGDDMQQRRKLAVMLGQVHQMHARRGFHRTVGVGEDVQFATPGLHFLEVGLQLVEQLVVRGDGNHRHVGIDQRKRADTTGTPASPTDDADAPVDISSLAYFEKIWAELKVEQQLAEALAQAPENAGPLNSHLLALQSLKLMRDLSPGYLKRFVSYVDALLWLDQADNAGKPVAKGERDKKRKPIARGKKA